MGRQLPLAVTANDAVALVNFIYGQSPCLLSVGHAPNPDDIWLDEWGPDLFRETFTVYIWPTAFPWQPVYARRAAQPSPITSRDYWHISNDAGAPLIELSGNNLIANRPVPDALRPPDRPRSVRYGRIYWSKDFGREVKYDLVAFSRLIDRIWGWIRKAGKKRPDDRDGNYFLPEALRQVSGMSQGT